MWNKLPDWLKKAWAIIAGLTILIGALASVAALVEFFEDRRATPTLSPTDVPTGTPVPTMTPAPTLTPTLGTLQFLDFPAQVKAGEDIKITVQAWQGTTCHLAYYTPDGSLSSARGLGLAIVDSHGRCTWEWHISANTNPGCATLEISVGNIRESHELEILPAK